MKKTGWKQLVLSVLGALFCKISVMGCYPLVPAFFAAVYLEEQGRWLLSMGMLTGMVAFLPITVIAKYAMSLLLIGITVQLSEWVDKRCYTAAAALAAAGGTLALSIFGGIFDFKNQVTIAAAICEAVFIFGFGIILGTNRFNNNQVQNDTHYGISDLQDIKNNKEYKKTNPTPAV